MDYVLDTHPLVFLMFEPEALGSRARKAIADHRTTLLVPTMAVLELQYLIEIGRVEGRATDVIDYIEQTPRIRLIAFSESELRESVVRLDTRDPFDRVILASAMCRDLPVITRDRWMRRVYRKTCW
ncbi:MAG: hypothetical protein GF331_16770 [Chitinivibrionales bacterium]|nr:hypothetical protein [Chitinivibrionales bacterium]